MSSLPHKRAQFTHIATHRFGCRPVSFDERSLRDHGRHPSTDVRAYTDAAIVPGGTERVCASLEALLERARRVGGIPDHLQKRAERGAITSPVG